MWIARFFSRSSAKRDRPADYTDGPKPAHDLGLIVTIKMIGLIVTIKMMTDAGPPAGLRR